MINSKPWWKSRTIWLNSFASLGAILSVAASDELLPPIAIKWGFALLAAANVWLRTDTKTAVTEK